MEPNAEVIEIYNEFMTDNDGSNYISVRVINVISRIITLNVIELRTRVNEQAVLENHEVKNQLTKAKVIRYAIKKFDSILKEHPSKDKMFWMNHR